MAIRISGGQWRGRIVPSPKTKGVRPTASRTREALFNILGGRVDEAVFWDLYAGSGIMGLEALSRGAALLLQIEKNFQNVKALQNNISQLHANPKITRIVRGDVLRFLEQTNDSADIIYADPPFTEEYPDLRIALDLLNDGGVLICEFPGRNAPDWIKAADDIRKYGESSLAFFYKDKNE
jgi:16S rRNA (guanine966-N2)-methyltransferase